MTIENVERVKCSIALADRKIYFPVTHRVSMAIYRYNYVIDNFKVLVFRKFSRIFLIFSEKVR